MSEKEKDKAAESANFLGMRILTPLEEESVEGGLAPDHHGHEHTGTTDTDHDHE